jgi:hypothetical protein
MALSKLAVRRLTKLADYMEGLPKKAYEHFYMGTFFHHSGSHGTDANRGQALGEKHLLDCGTSACALGWAATVPDFKKAGLKLEYHGNGYANVICPNATNAMDAAMAFFDLESNADQAGEQGPLPEGLEAHQRGHQGARRRPLRVRGRMRPAPDHPGPRRCVERNGEPAKWAKGKVVLTVAHLNHTPEDCRDENLKAMCQRCHLRYDHDHHQRNAYATRRKGKAALLQPMNLEERVLFFSSWLAVVLGHMKAAVGHDGARGVVDALKLLADGELAPASETKAIDPNSRLYDALLELVECKDLIDSVDKDFASDDPVLTTDQRNEARAEYKRRKPLAWDRAREALIACVPPETRAPVWVSPTDRQPDVDGRLWAILTERREYGKLTGYVPLFEYYHFDNGWATDDRILFWLDSPLHPLPQVPHE